MAARTTQLIFEDSTFDGAEHTLYTVPADVVVIVKEVLLTHFASGPKFWVLTVHDPVQGDGPWLAGESGVAPDLLYRTPTYTVLEAGQSIASFAEGGGGAWRCVVSGSKLTAL